MANRVGYEYWVVQTDVVEPHKIGIEADIGDGIYDLGLKNLDEVKRTMGLCYLPDGSRPRWSNNFEWTPTQCIERSTDISFFVLRLVKAYLDDDRYPIGDYAYAYIDSSGVLQDHFDDVSKVPMKFKKEVAKHFDWVKSLRRLTWYYAWENPKRY